jgi:hypothetical protein
VLHRAMSKIDGIVNGGVLTGPTSMDTMIIPVR